MVLAGYRGSGKSTLLGLAHAQRGPLFGDAYVDAFAATSPPTAAREADVPFEEAMRTGSWLSASHLLGLLGQAEMPAQAVIHWDFISLVQMMRHLQDMSPEKLAGLLVDRARAEALIGLQLKVLAQLAERFDTVSVTTLFCPWTEICRRVQQRAYGSETLSSHLFDARTPEIGQRIHGNLYRAWMKHLPKVPCVRRFARWTSAVAA